MGLRRLVPARAKPGRPASIVYASEQFLPTRDAGFTRATVRNKETKKNQISNFRQEMLTFFFGRIPHFLLASHAYAKAAVAA